MLEACLKLKGKAGRQAHRGAEENIFETWAVKSAFLQHKITELVMTKDIPAKVQFG